MAANPGLRNLNLTGVVRAWCDEAEPDRSILLSEGTFPSAVVWESSVTPFSTRTANSRSPQRVPVSGLGLRCRVLQSLCGDSQTDWLATPTSCKPPADVAERGLQGPEPALARRPARLAFPPFAAPLMSLGTRAPNGWGEARAPGLTSSLYRQQPG